MTSSAKSWTHFWICSWSSLRSSENSDMSSPSSKRRSGPHAVPVGTVVRRSVAPALWAPDPASTYPLLLNGNLCARRFDNHLRPKISMPARMTRENTRAPAMTTSPPPTKGRATPSRAKASAPERRARRSGPATESPCWAPRAAPRSPSGARAATGRRAPGCSGSGPTVDEERAEATRSSAGVHRGDEHEPERLGHQSERAGRRRPRGAPPAGARGLPARARPPPRPRRRRRPIACQAEAQTALAEQGEGGLEGAERRDEQHGDDGRDTAIVPERRSASRAPGGRATGRARVRTSVPVGPRSRADADRHDGVERRRWRPRRRTGGAARPARPGPRWRGR